MDERTRIDEPPDDVDPWPGEADAARLFALVRDSCAGKTGLPARLEAAIRAALDALAADPDLAYRLTVDPHLGSDAAQLAERMWIRRFADLLREAVADDPDTTTANPPFLAALVIGGVRFQIARLVLNGEAADLRRLRPGLVEGLLAYYFEPGESRRLARAALRSQD